jgi:hypothetical protein
MMAVAEELTVEEAGVVIAFLQRMREAIEPHPDASPTQRPL